MPKFIKGQRKIVLGLVCGVISAVALYLGMMGRPADESVVVPSRLNESGENKDVFLVAGNGVLRDPFRVKSTVAAVEALLPTIAKAVVTPKEERNVQIGHKDFRLAGVAESDGIYVAILTWNKQSGVYKVNEQVGGYQISSIDNQGVVLRGNRHEIYLRVGGL